MIWWFDNGVVNFFFILDNFFGILFFLCLKFRKFLLKYKWVFKFYLFSFYNLIVECKKIFGEKILYLE